MPNKILILDSDQTTLAWLQASLEQQGFACDTATLGVVALEKIAAAPPDLLVLDGILPDIDGIEVIQRVRNDPHSSHVRIIVLSTVKNLEIVAASMNAGANQYVVKRPGADVELTVRIYELLAQAKPSRGRIFTFCSAKGGSGTTSVCVNTAVALAKQVQQARVLLVDMVFPFGTIGTALDFESAYSVSQLSQETTIDSATIEKYVSRPTRWGFRVLLGANGPEEAGNLDVSKIQPIFDTLQTDFDFVLVDIGRTLSRISLPLLEMSSDIVIVVTPDIATVKAAKHLVQYLDSHNIPRKRLLVVNNRTVGRVWTTADDMTREFGIAPRLTIPYLVEYMTMAINEAVPFVDKFPENSAALTFSELANVLLESKVEASELS